VRAFLLHLSKRLCHVFELIPNIKAYVDRRGLLSRHRDTIARPRIDLDDLLLLQFALCTEDKSRKTRPVRRQSSQGFEDRRDRLPEALSFKCCPGFHLDDLGVVPAFNMLGRGNRLHGKGFGMMLNLVDPSAGWGVRSNAAPLFARVAKSSEGFHSS
jgi:hypothetical protein